MRNPRDGKSEKSPVSVLGDLIANRRDDIERRWLERVERDVARTPDVEPTQLRDGLPDYLEALARLLRSGKTEVELSSEPDAGSTWANVAREHGITRVRIGFDITQLVHEFIILRRVIRDVGREHGVPAGGPETVLADMLDSGVSVAVQSYVEARDFETRKRQAEHVGFLTHELRNPLSAAMLAATRLRQVPASEYPRIVDVLDRNHKKLNDLIDSVLLSQKLEAGKVQCQPSDVRLGDLMERALEGARAVALEKGVAFRAEYDPELHVRVDPELTGSALQNLADNAARYTDAGSIEITQEDRGDDFVIHFRDSCHGISHEELRTIFEPFERGRTRKSGTGLGLAIARRAVEAQGGSIDVESPGPSGCHFWVQLPK
jgi:signal transduction histidine kinase